jgi:hypothetical protein
MIGAPGPENGALQNVQRGFAGISPKTERISRNGKAGSFPVRIECQNSSAFCLFAIHILRAVEALTFQTSSVEASATRAE